jgi:hypothetical protein
MTQDEFDTLNIGTNIYYFNNIELLRILTFNAVIVKGTITDSVICAGVKGYVVDDCFTILVEDYDDYFLTEEEAMICKLEDMRQIIAEGMTYIRPIPPLKDMSTFPPLVKLDKIINSKKIGKLLLDSHPEIFI